jgi:Family of unknown function (DUF5715)
VLRNLFITLTLAALSVTPGWAASPQHATGSARAAKAHPHASGATHPHSAPHTASRPSTYRGPSPGHYANHYSTPHRAAGHSATHGRAATQSHTQFRWHAPETHRSPAIRHSAPAPASGPAIEAASLHRYRPAPMPPPMLGSAASLARQNQINESEGLERILDNQDLEDRIAQHLLIPLPASSTLLVNDSLPANRRYCRSWTARFLTDFARAHAARFHGPILVSSAVRTVEYQKQLIHINGNAAAAEGDVVSPHLTGATIDIAKGTMSRQEVGWVRSWLLPLQLAGKIDVEEEFQQACFHITVYKTYAPPPPPPGQHHRPRRAAPQAELASRGR